MFWKKKNKREFWSSLKEKHPEGIFTLAPMADVTDNPFRRILSEIGPPDVYWTEFVAGDGLAHPVGNKRLRRLLTYEKNQRPIIAQIFSGNPENIRKAARICADLGFDGIDINTGCPQRNILKQMCGSELIKKENREIARAVIAACKEGAGDIPVSVKTRLGFNSIDMSWIEFLLEQDLPVITIHLRTRKEMSKVPAHFELLPEIVALRDKIAPETLIIANGDIVSHAQGKDVVKQYGVDGVMIGRGLFTNPWIFDKTINPDEKSREERIALAMRHSEYFESEFGETKKNIKDFGGRIRSFHLMKKFYKVYINGFDGAKELRTQMMACKDFDGVKDTINKHESSLAQLD